MISMCKENKHDMYLSFGPMLICRKCYHKRKANKEDLQKIDKGEKVTQ